MFAALLLKKTFDVIAQAVTPSHKYDVTTHSHAGQTEATFNSFLGGAPVMYAVLEHEPPMPVPCRPETQPHALNDMHQFWMQQQKTCHL